MPGMVEQKRAHVRHTRPDRSFVVSLAVGIYSILPAIISIHFFGFELVPYILTVSALGFVSSFALYFRSAGMRSSGFKKAYMGSLQVMGDVFGRGILLVLYYTVFIIPGIPVAAFADKLQIKKKPTSWIEKADEEHTIERAREQW